jgi:hypothetical protein
LRGRTQARWIIVTKETPDADLDDQNRGFGGESLEAVNQRLKDGGITFHLSEVKGRVMDRLKRSHFLEELTGKVHLTQYDAVSSINPDLARRTREAKRVSRKRDDGRITTEAQITEGESLSWMTNLQEAGKRPPAFPGISQERD